MEYICRDCAPVPLIFPFIIHFSATGSADRAYIFYRDGLPFLDEDPIEKIVEEIIAFDFSSPSPSSGSKIP